TNTTGEWSAISVPISDLPLPLGPISRMMRGFWPPGGRSIALPVAGIGEVAWRVCMQVFVQDAVDLPDMMVIVGQPVDQQIVRGHIARAVMLDAQVPAFIGQVRQP